MPETTNNNQNQNSWLPDKLASIQLHTQQVAKSENGWKEETHQKMADLKKLAVSPEAGTNEGISKLEEGFGNLGMPGVRDTNDAINQLDRREEAMFEERSLRGQGKSYTSLEPRQKQEAEARIYNGVNFRNDWYNVCDYIRTNKQRFEVEPTTPIGKEILRQLQIITGNEIRLILARNPQIGIDFKDNNKIIELTDKIIKDPDFISLLNNEDLVPNTTRIKIEIEKRLTKYHETSGNI